MEAFAKPPECRPQFFRACPCLHTKALIKIGSGAGFNQADRALWLAILGKPTCPALSNDFPWDLLAWQPNSQQLQQLQELQLLLRHWNQQLNLTRLVEGPDYWIGQVFDSLWPLQPWLTGELSSATCAQKFSVVDVGTGGGFPGLAIAIALPNAQLTLVDSVGRKLEAVGAMAKELGLGERLSLRCERAEKSGRERSCRGQFQLAVARAVAPAAVVAEYLVPLLAPNGTALLYRGQWSAANQAELVEIARQLKAEAGEPRAIELPEGKGQRHVIPLTPVAACPTTYPRAVGIPAKQPLRPAP